MNYLIFHLYILIQYGLDAKILITLTILSGFLYFYVK